jgi:hypothetical protein
MEQPGGSDNSLWIIYQSVREESISAQQAMQQVINWSIASGAVIIALLTYLVKEVNDARVILIGGWLVILLFSLLGISQYAGEAGRMLRAGYYARLLEAYHWNKSNASLPLSLMWETFLSESSVSRKKSRRLNISYSLSAVGAMAGLIVLQFAPFWLLSDKPAFKLSWWWLLLPVCGSSLSIIFMIWQIRDYTQRFSQDLSGIHLLEAHNIQIQNTISKNSE